MASEDEAALVALLNSTPVEDGSVRDLLSERGYAAGLARDLGGRGDEAEVAALLRVRDPLQATVRTGRVASGLESALSGVVQRPVALGPDGLRWELDGPAAGLPAARAVLAWAEVVATRPGRLRACGNDECRRFLLDHSRANSARWCSMAVCGNRMKARRHYSRLRDADPQR